MKSKSTIITLLLAVAILVLGIAYAALASQTLSVTGSATVATSADNFKVDFTTTSNEITTTAPTGVTATASRTGERTAAITVTGLTTKGQEVIATLPIKNNTPAEANVYAQLNITASGTTNEWFTITSELEDTSALAPGASTNLKVKIKLNKTPITEEEVALVNGEEGSINTILVTVNATPIQQPS